MAKARSTTTKKTKPSTTKAPAKKAPAVSPEQTEETARMIAKLHAPEPIPGSEEALDHYHAAHDDWSKVTLTSDILEEVDKIEDRLVRTARCLPRVGVALDVTTHQLMTSDLANLHRDLADLRGYANSLAKILCTEDGWDPEVLGDHPTNVATLLGFSWRKRRAPVRALHASAYPRVAAAEKALVKP